MALAVLKPMGGNRFRFDIGKNRYYTYAIGDKERIRRHGVLMLDAPKFKSDLIGPLPERAMGRGEIEIPSRHVDREHRYVQLLSFQDKDLSGPAISDIVTVTGISRQPNDDLLPGPAWSLGLWPADSGSTNNISGLPIAEQQAALTRNETMDPYNVESYPHGVNPSDSQYPVPQALSEGPMETVPFHYQEARFSNAMFLGALTSLLPAILPGVGNLLGGLLGGGKGGGKKSAGVSPSPGGGASPGIEDLLKSLMNPNTMKQITDLVGNIANVAKAKSVQETTAAFDTSPSSRFYQNCSRQPSLSSQAAINAKQWPTGLGDEYGQAQDYSEAHDYSEAMIAPALLAALPALMPLLKNVLNPQTIKTVVDAPNRATQTVINGLKDFAKLGIQSHEQDLSHLRKLNPGVDDPALDKLLMSMSQGIADFQREANYKRVDSVALSFDDVATQTIFGRTKIPYLYGQALAFPLTVKTPKTIGNSWIQLQVKDTETLEILYQAREKVGQVSSGPLAVVPSLDLAAVKQLQANKEYLICTALIWKNKEGKRRGASMQQRISLVSNFIFDRVEESSQLIPLNDMSRYRHYWHKVWSGSFSDDTKRFELDSKYYYVLNGKKDNHARLETRTKTEMDDRKRIGRLKSGMELSPFALNRLLPQIVPGVQPLGQEQLKALTSSDFSERFNQAARYNAQFRGRTGESAALWVYPEFKLQNVVLLKTADVNSNGNVRSMGESVVQFPMPVQVHFIGLKTE